MPIEARAEPGAARKGGPRMKRPRVGVGSPSPKRDDAQRMPAGKDLGDDRLPGLEDEQLSQLLKHLGLEAPLCVTTERTSVDDDVAAEAEHGVPSESHCAWV